MGGGGGGLNSFVENSTFLGRRRFEVGGGLRGA